MSKNQKKILANQIKEDLQKDLEKAKKGEKNENGNYDISWRKTLGEDCSECRGNEWRFTYFGSRKTDSGKKYKERINGRGWIEVFSEELEPDDWKEIESLIQQIKNLEEEKKEKETQKYREEQAKIDQKLSSKSKMFLYEGMQEWVVDYDPRGYDKFHVFRGAENGQKFHLTFPKNHPSVVNSYNHNERTFFQIEGAENMPFQPKEKGQLPWKKANLTDKITITEYNDAENKTNHNSRPSDQSKEGYAKLLLIGTAILATVILISALIIIRKRKVAKVARKSKK